ncbi:conserved membrane hypothetical protein [Bradyrhizobium sp. ORS 375]|uniref:hypothetical protein n=1 Tax=Bradyrhizobium sp. (strain ORS 375) TaxID=566679 RepID=UPI0002406E90|nr:hypothetical protein [Bradyrhizobium sp. ORS 375]CCD91924.1 conserved membrane hypothetical protein [Bradyrhizobium sp. ORS 375]
MIGTLLIALAAGAASAVMFASTVSGVMLSLVLALFAPVPLMVAGIAWGRLCAAIGGLFATACVLAVFSFSRAEIFAISVALPAWWLGHLVLLGRTMAGPSGQDTVEWYPPGNILLWVAVIAGLIVAFAFGTDVSATNQSFRRLLERVLARTGTPEGVDIPRLLELLVFMAPLMVAMIMTTILTLNVVIAAKITAISGRLMRPWPRLRETKLPLMTLPALFAIIAFCFPEGLVGLLARIAAAALLTAYALTGLAVLHTLTLPMRTRPLWLGLAYALIPTFIWPLPVLAMVALGLADAAFDLRHRFGPRRPPPLPVP